ncbi:MAG: dual specificity protein phosphatase family protein [Oscillatoriaceae cyanobacterium Prado104]|jgi:hypothetical protein|nr:dual specificity protein phosphatase family protein [Oscillatoriaceae cyanobacterium Prado104]
MNAVRPWLYIGKYRDTLDRSYLAANRIGAMLQLAEHVEQAGIVSRYLAVEDGQGLSAQVLREGLDFVCAMREQQRRVLIACGAGISRSAAFATAALKEAEGLGLLVALQEIKQRHPETYPHFALWNSLCSYYGEDVELRTFFRVLNRSVDRM